MGKLVYVQLLLVVLIVFSQVSLAIEEPSLEGKILEILVNDNLAETYTSYTLSSEGTTLAKKIDSGALPPTRILLRGDQEFWATNGFCRVFLGTCGNVRPDFILYDGFNKNVIIGDTKLSGKTRNQQEDVMVDLTKKLNQNKRLTAEIKYTCYNCNPESYYKNGIKYTFIKYETKKPLLETDVGERLVKKYNFKPSGDTIKKIGKGLVYLEFVGIMDEYINAVQQNLDARSLQECYNNYDETVIALEYYYIDNEKYYLDIYANHQKKVKARALCGCKTGDEKKKCCFSLINNYYEINDLIKTGQMCIMEVQSIDNPKEDGLYKYPLRDSVVKIANKVNEITGMVVGEIVSNLGSDAQDSLNKVSNNADVAYKKFVNVTTFKCFTEKKNSKGYCKVVCKCENNEGQCDFNDECKSGYCNINKKMCEKKPLENNTKKKCFFGVCW